MEHKYLKDFVIALVVILILIYAIKDYYLLKKTQNISMESRYAEMALSEELLDQIKEIEKSIQDRKQFVFSVTKDPLEQNLIVKTKQDLEKQWKEEVEQMVRLESTIIPKAGNKRAAISYQGKTKLYKIGDRFDKGIITDIDEGEVSYKYKNTSGKLYVQKIPPKPVAIRKERRKKREYNW